MRKNNKWYLIGFLSLAAIIIFLVILFFLNRIKSEIFGLISIYGYFAIFIVAFLVDILVQPLGPEVPLIAASTLRLNIIIAAFLIIIASTLASFFNYRVGKIFHSTASTGKKAKKYLKLYKKYGKYALLISAIGPVPYVPFCWFSGSFKLPIKKFIYWGILPRTLRIITVAYILFLFL